MSRTLSLHIGNHKTASTSLQHAFGQSSDARIFNHYAERPKKKNKESWSGNSWVIKLPDTARQGAMIDPALAHELAQHNPDGDVIFSAEDLSWVFDAHEIEDFAHSLRKSFDKIEVIVYLRRQDRNMLSFYQEGLKWHPTRFSRFTGLDARSLPPYEPFFDRYFDYHERIGYWADAFGDTAMRIFNFDEIAKNEGIFAHFGALLDFDFGDFQPHYRQSHSYIRQLMQLRIAKLGKSVELSRWSPEVSENVSAMHPPRAEVQDFYAHFRESNRRLNQRFQLSTRPEIFDDDFSQFSAEGNENWNEHAADIAVDYLLTCLSEAQAEIHALKKAARKSQE